MSNTSEDPLEVPVDSLSDLGDLLSDVSDEDVEAALSKGFQMLDRLVTVLRVYPNHHPVVEAVAKRCVERLSTVLHTDPVSIVLTPTELLTESGKSVFSKEMSETDRFIWYSAHSDGLRLFTLHPGLDVEEIQQFMRVIDGVSQGTIGSDDDAVTLLWELHLKTISYFSVDAFIDAEIVEEFNNRTAQEMVDLVIEAAIEQESAQGQELQTMFQSGGIKDLDWFSSKRLRATLATGVNPVGKEHLEYALALQVDKINALYEEWSSGSNLEFRFFEALLSIIRSAPGSKPAEYAQEVIEKMTLEIIDREMYDAAVRVLRLFANRQDIFEGGDNPLEAIIEKVSEPVTIEGLVWRMQKSEAHRDTLCELLPLLKHDVVERQVLTLLSGTEELPDVACAVDVLFAVGRSPVDEKLLEKGHFVGRLLAQFPGRDLTPWAGSRQVIARAVADPRLQQTALALNVPFWSDDGLAKKALLPLIKHTDEDIRSRAYELLAEHHPKIFEDRIRELLRNREFKGRSAGELRFLFRKFVENNQGPFPDLYECIKKGGGWLKSPGNTAAKVAAQVLLARGDEQVVEIVRQRAASLWTAPALKSTYRQLLQAQPGLNLAASAPDDDPSAGAD